MSDENAVELYRKYRPRKLSEVVGQKDAVNVLMDMGKRGAIPHCLLFTGPSGCGKTTLARILKEKLKCSDFDYFEINASEARGIDEIRSINDRKGSAAMTSGGCRIWYIDECHGLTGPAQEAFLKSLEDTPPHVYFFLATTNPGKLIKTIQTRCTEIRCKPLSESDLIEVMKKVCEADGKTVDEKVLQKIASVADSSARLALVILHKVIGLPTVDEQIKAIDSADVKGQAIELCRILMNKSAGWKDVTDVLSRLEEDAEAVRRVVLGYCKAILLKSGNSRAALIMEEFRDPLYDLGFPGLVLNCFNVMNPV